MGSSRFPGKVLAPLAGRPLLAFMLDRLREAGLGRIVVATSTKPADDAIAALGADVGVDVVRGPEHDVLARFAAVHDRFGGRDVIRLTGDCPLTDPQLVLAALARHRDVGADYTSNVFPR